jgi:nucleoside-diphosphate-sugar epimerase
MILVTGANGFMGTRLCEVLHERHFSFKMAVRGTYSQAISIGDIDSHTNWQVALNQVTTVVHIAARVHVMNDKSTDPLAEFRKVNVDGTLNLARQAASAGVTRFVFISSIKVNGEKTTINHRFMLMILQVRKMLMGFLNWKQNKDYVYCQKKREWKSLLFAPLWCMAQE